MNLLSSFGPAAAAAAVTVSTTPVLSDSPSTCTSLSSSTSHHINSSSASAVSVNGYTNLTGHPVSSNLFNSSQFHHHHQHHHPSLGHNGYNSPSVQSHLSNYLNCSSGNSLPSTPGHTPLTEYGIMNNLSIPMYATKRRRRNSKWWVGKLNYQLVLVLSRRWDWGIIFITCVYLLLLYLSFSSCIFSFICPHVLMAYPPRAHTHWTLTLLDIT